MLLKSPQEWVETVKREQHNPYGFVVIQFCEAWTNFIEQKMAEGDGFLAAVEKPFESDLTVFQYSVAVEILSRTWIHGEELRRWHNLKHQLGKEGEKANDSGGVLNTAILNIGQKE